MPEPVRIQRRRTKGFKLVSPNGLPVVYVGRPTVFGNPFVWLGLEESLVAYRIAAQGGFNPTPFRGYSDSKFHLLYEDLRRWQDRLRGHPLVQIRDLRGKNLSCWCPLDQPCHADILLEVANA